MQALIGYIENDMQICFPYNLHQKITESWNKVLSIFYIAISNTVMTSLVLITTVSIEIIELYTANQVITNTLVLGRSGVWGCAN